MSLEYKLLFIWMMLHLIYIEKPQIENAFFLNHLHENTHEQVYIKIYKLWNELSADKKLY